MEYSNIPKGIGRKENNPTPHKRIIGLYVMFMKMKFSRDWWISAYAMVVMGILMEIFLSYFVIGSSGEDLVWGLGIMLGNAMMTAFVALLPWKYLMTMEINEKEIRSFLFGKLKCEVYTEQEIYYAIFTCKEGNSFIRTYIAISNEWFVYEERKPTIWSSNTFLDYYDRTKQIVFPYNEKTKHLFTIENWTRVN